MAQQAAGAFFGALFAFGFFLLSDHLSRMRERQRRHHTGLVTLEYRLNEYLCVISDDMYLIRHFRPTVEKGAVHWSLPRPLPLGEPVYLDLINLGVINEYFNLLVDLRKTNDDLQNIASGYGKVVDLYASRQSPPEEYKINALKMADGLETIGRALEAKEKQVQRLIAKARLLARKDSPNSRWLWWSTCTATLSEFELAAEVKKLGAEIAETKRKSMEEIDRVLGTAAG
jgi:hypothetical protein